MKVLFESTQIVSFGDTDPQGILYFAKIYDYAHQCLEAFTEKSEITWSSWFQHPEYAVPIKNANAEFMKPLRVGHKYLNRMMLERVGDTSVTFNFDFMAEDATLCARVVTTHVFVDKKNFQKIKIPAAILKSLA